MSQSHNWHCSIKTDIKNKRIGIMLKEPINTEIRPGKSVRCSLDPETGFLNVPKFIHIIQ